MKSIIINAKEVTVSMRMDGSFHLSDTTLIEREIVKIGFKPLSNFAERIFTAGRNKRVYTTRDFGFPYLSNSNVMSRNPFLDCNFNSKKYGFDENAFLKEGMIVTGRVGAIGQTAYISKYYEEMQSMGSDNIIRIVLTDPNISGFIYAFLASKYGNTFLWKFATGGVQPYINEEMIGSIPIPIFSQILQNEVHNKIINAVKLRDQANNLLNSIRFEIEQLIEQKYDLSICNHKIHSSIKLKDIRKFEQRFDAPYYSGLGRRIYDKIITGDYMLLSEVSEIFHPILFGKKQLKGTVNKGNALYKSSSMMQLKPLTDFWLSQRKISQYSKLQVKKDWVLVSRTGTVGNVVGISERFNDVYIDDHMIRIIPKTNFFGLIYLYLSSKQGKELINFQKYGSVQDVINSNYIERIPIPKFLINDEFLFKTQEISCKANDYFDLADKLEQEAFHLIENEIEQWQH